MKKTIAFLFGLLAWLLLIGSGLVFGADLTVWGFDGSLAFRDFGKLWFDLHHSSLNLTQAIIQRHLVPALFDSVLLPVLLSPAVLVLFCGSLVFFLSRRLLSR